MTRQIKFRAWDGEKFYSPIIDGGKVFRDGRSYEDCIPASDSVMQYTGLTDKHGVDIYEGDVINFDRHLWEIKFVHGCFRAYNLTNPDQIGEFYGPDQLSFGSMDDELVNVEVVANVHENPELLEP